MSVHVGVLPFQIADGPWNMAADEALLTSAAAGGRASLRFYGWSAPTLTLGYFQPAAPALACASLAGLPWLRRPSGGAALVHHHELTYALAIPPGSPFQPSARRWLPLMHEVIRAVLGEAGITAHLCREEHKYGEILCFLHHTPCDLLIGSAKVVGSAQRKQRGALLQHGGILLARSPCTPSLPGIAELSGVHLSVDALQTGLVEAFRRATGWICALRDWTSDEQQNIATALPRYTSADWNQRR